MEKSEKSFTVIIPSRLSSNRLPYKPLADICGKPMIIRVAEQAKKSGADRVIIAVDDKKIFDICQEAGFEVFMTSQHHLTGTDRLSEIVQILNFPDSNIIVNLQGDEPFMPEELIRKVAYCLIENADVNIATAATPISDLDEIQNPNVVKVVMNHKQRALYFSRAVIPFSIDIKKHAYSYHRHIGIYAYSVKTLKEFVKIQSPLIEQIELLEQLRGLWFDYHIQVVITSLLFMSVDTPEDLERARHFLKNNL